MRYFIPQDNELLEVSDAYYETWYELCASQFLLPEISFTTEEGNEHFIETMYLGACDVSEMEPLPFVVIFFPDKMIITENGVTTIPQNEEFYFKTFEEMKAKYNSLLNQD
jgi:hypothetical protein